MFAKRNKIYVGSLTEPDFYFENDKIEAISTSQAVSIIGQELSIDILLVTVKVDVETIMERALFMSSDGKTIKLSNGSLYILDITESSKPSPITQISVGTPLWYFCLDELVGKFYLETVKRVGKGKYQLKCVSAVGRLDKMEHGGGLFLATTFGDVLESIMTG